MADTNPDHRIRAGLKFLAKADSHIKKALIDLNKCFSGTLPDLTIASHHFDVKTGTGTTKRYHGRMTKEQYKRLHKPANLNSLEHFADAVSSLLIKVDEKANKASENLLGSLSIRMIKFVYPPEGTCTYDNNEHAQCTQTACTEGLLGTWLPL